MKRKICVACLLFLALFVLSACSKPSAVLQTNAGSFKTGTIRLHADYSPQQTPSEGTEFLAIPLISQDNSVDMSAVSDYFMKDNQTFLSANGTRGALKFIAYESPKSNPNKVCPVLVFEVGTNAGEDLYPMTIEVGSTSFVFS